MASKEVQHITRKMRRKAKRVSVLVVRNDLYKWFDYMGFRTGCEVGVSRGYNAKEMCKRIPDLKLYLVDPYYKDLRGRHKTPKQYRWARNRMRRCAEIYGTDYKFIKDFSINAVDKVPMLDFVYIDADHTYSHIKQDIEIWSLKVRSGGAVCGHDFYGGCREVINAVNDYQAEHNIPTVFYTVKDRRHSWFWIKL